MSEGIFQHQQGPSLLVRAVLFAMIIAAGTGVVFAVRGYANRHDVLSETRTWTALPASSDPDPKQEITALKSELGQERQARRTAETKARREEAINRNLAVGIRDLRGRLEKGEKRVETPAPPEVTPDMVRRQSLDMQEQNLRRAQRELSDIHKRYGGR